MSYFSNKTVIVTGATGLIGSNLVMKLLKDETTRVIAIGRNHFRLLEVFEDIIHNKNLILLEHDISMPIEWSEPVDFIFHAAGPIAGNIIIETPISVILPNIMGTLNVLDFMLFQREEKGVDSRLVVFSSATVYGNASSEDILVEEKDTILGDSLDSSIAPYSESKRMIEVMAKSYVREEKLDISIVRLSYVYGFAKIQPNVAIYHFIQEALDGRDIILKKSGLPRRDNIYIEDAIEGLMYVAERGEKGESYNVSSNCQGSNFASIDEIASIIALVVNKKKSKMIKVLYSDRSENAKRAPGIILSNKKLKSLGWQLKNDLERGIEKTIELYS